VPSPGIQIPPLRHGLESQGLPIYLLMSFRKKKEKKKKGSNFESTLVQRKNKVKKLKASCF